MSRRISTQKSRLSSVSEIEEKKKDCINDENKQTIVGAAGGTGLDQNGNPPEQLDTSSSESEGEEEKKKVAVKPVLVEKQQEAQLKAKYGNLKPRTAGGGSMLARKRLERGVKFFDSGDYNMVKKKPGLSGNAAVSSKTKPQKSASKTLSESKISLEQDRPVRPEDVPDAESAPVPSADAIISHRLLLFRTKSNSESQSEDDPSFQEVKQAILRRSSLYTPQSTPLLDAPQTGGARRGSMYPLSNPDTEMVPPSMDFLQRRRQSMVPSIPSKLAL